MFVVYYYYTKFTITVKIHIYDKKNCENMQSLWFHTNLVANKNNTTV